MNNIFEQCTVDGELTPELIKRKQELDQLMDVELSEIEAGKGQMWVPKEKQYAEVHQKYEDIWEQELTDAGYIVRPIFESVERWYDTLSKLNEAVDKDEVIDDLYYRGMKRDFGVYEDTVAYEMAARASEVFDMDYEEAEDLAWKVISRMKNNGFDFIEGEE
jgi:hypothetical protein